MIIQYIKLNIVSYIYEKYSFENTFKKIYIR